MDQTNVKLALLDRLLLPTIFPEIGSLQLVRSVDNLKNRIQVTPEEWVKFDISIATEDSITPNRINWNTEGATAQFDFCFDSSELETIKSALVQLDKCGKVSAELLSLYDKFL